MFGYMISWESKGINIDCERLNHLRFAHDNIILIAEDGHKLEEMLNDLITESN